LPSVFPASRSAPSTSRNPSLYDSYIPFGFGIPRRLFNEDDDDDAGADDDDDEEDDEGDDENDTCPSSAS